MSNDKEGGGFMGGFLLGALVGAGVGLLLAPRPGEETRQILAEKSDEILSHADQWRSQAEQAKAALREVADEFVGRARVVIDEQREALRAAFEEGRQAAEQAAAELQARIHESRQAPADSPKS
ncbi:MAG: YtxH domain-containing protein [Chloroflexi bacterium]|nr:YtxH domain-containing protein [Chloroflexota bacterium]